MNKDRYGLVLTTTSAIAAEKYQLALDSSLAGNAFSEKWFEEALALDQTFALALSANAEIALSRGKTSQAALLIKRALNLSKNASQREKQHIQIIATLMDGKSELALKKIEEHVKDFPNDAYLVSKAVGGFGLYAFNGKLNHPEKRLDFMNALKDAYGNDWWFLSLYSFALVETFQIKEARKAVELSLSLNLRNGHAAHSFAHVCYESGQTKECIDFVSEWVKGYEREAHLYGHIHWHWALSEMSNGNLSKAHQIYDEHLKPSVSLGDALGLIADAASIDWRASVLGFKFLEEAEKLELQKYVLKHKNLNGAIFGEAHLALIYADRNLNNESGKLFDIMNKRYQQTNRPMYKMMQTLIAGVNAFAQEDYLTCIDQLSNARKDFIRLGGSNAQRELFEETLLRAYLKLGKTDKVKELVETKLHKH
ncbi:MAG: hypothetical protein EAZ07_08820 [Cytophagales bacterium]|nr:MAG: hypothetical protein EAZ07_08820 [Cytophagales bacterium]